MNLKGDEAKFPSASLRASGHPYVRPPAPPEIRAAVSRLRRAIALAPPIADPACSAAVFAQVGASIATVSREDQSRWSTAIRAMAEALGYSKELLALSLLALVRPLRDVGWVANTLHPRRELMGFIMPGNMPGAGLHELVTALLAGCAALVKTSAAEPIFFAELATTLRELDAGFGSDFGERLAVFNWGREDQGLTETLLESCDRIVALGADATIAHFAHNAGGKDLVGFGSRVSGAAVMREAVRDNARLAQTARAVALDCALFDQRGCLSPHHVFVEYQVREFAAQLAASFGELRGLFDKDGGPRRMELENAVAVRRAREVARWRAIGGGAVQLWEDHNFHSTVVFDQDARFTASPGFRTVYVSPFANLADLERRLEPARGGLEAFAVAGDESRVRVVRTMLQSLGASYICPPGEMQSPPLDWPHGGGDFIRLMLGEQVRSPGAKTLHSLPQRK